MRRFAISRRVGRRGTFLLFLAMLDWVYGYALAFPTVMALKSPAYMFLAQVAPISFWAALWITVGSVCFVYAFRKKDAPAYGIAMFLKVMWAILFLLADVIGGVDRGYLSTVIWGAFAAVLGLIATWPDDVKMSGDK